MSGYLCTYPSPFGYAYIYLFIIKLSTSIFSLLAWEKNWFYKFRMLNDWFSWLLSSFLFWTGVWVSYRPSSHWLFSWLFSAVFVCFWILNFYTSIEYSPLFRSLLTLAPVFFRSDWKCLFLCFYFTLICSRFKSNFPLIFSLLILSKVFWLSFCWL